MAKQIIKDKDKIDDLLNQIKSNPVEVPLQHVVPVTESKLVDHVRYSLWLPEEYLNKLKQLALNKSSGGNKVYVKDLINEAIRKEYME